MAGARPFGHSRNSLNSVTKAGDELWWQSQTAVNLSWSQNSLLCPSGSASCNLSQGCQHEGVCLSSYVIRSWERDWRFESLASHLWALICTSAGKCLEDCPPVSQVLSTGTVHSKTVRKGGNGLERAHQRGQGSRSCQVSASDWWLAAVIPEW